MSQTHSDIVRACFVNNFILSNTEKTYLLKLAQDCEKMEKEIISKNTLIATLSQEKSRLEERNQILAETIKKTINHSNTIDERLRQVEEFITK